MHPNFLGLGAARAGSTWIARNLMLHPDVFLPGKKELHYFDRYYAEGPAYYQQEFSEWSGESAVGEITPQYFHNPAVAPIIADQFPGIKLFVCLRNPVERAYSHYWRLVAVNSDNSQEPFEKMLQISTEILDVGCYYDHLTRYYRYIDPEQMLVLIFDDLQSDPETFLSRIYGFLDVEDQSSTLLAHQRINAAASHQDLGKSKALWHAYRLISRFGLYNLSNRLERINSRDLPPMQDQTKEYLIDYYAEQISKLQVLVDRDLSHWVT